MNYFTLAKSTFTLVLAGFSLGVLAYDNKLKNPGAETNLVHWEVTAGSPAPVSADCILDGITFVATGKKAFSMDNCGAVDGSGDGDSDGTAYVAQLSQTVNTTGCNFDPGLGDLSGKFRFETQYQTHGDDRATMGITFWDDSNVELASTFNLIPHPNGLPKFRSAGISGVIPAYAAEAELMIGGKGGSASDMTPGAYHDDVSYNFTHCVAAFGKTSSKTVCTGGNTSNGEGSGNGQFVAIADCDDDNSTQDTTIVGPLVRNPSADGEVLFEDAIFIAANLGLLEWTDTDDPETFPYSGTPAAGSYIFFNSKKPSVQSWCMVTPEEGAVLTIEADGWSIGAGWNGHCEELGGDIIDGPWGLETSAENPPASPGKGRDKSRGIFHPDPTIDWTLVRGSSTTGEVK